MEAMNATECIQHMIKTSGKRGVRVSSELGKSKNYISAMIAQQNDPSCQTMAAIAKVCGYDLILKGHDEEIVIDPKQN